MNARQSTIPCVVRNVSDSGARLRVDGSLSAPDTFELFIELDGSWVACEVVWRIGNEVGVRFTVAMELKRPTRTQVVGALVPQAKISLRRKPLGPD